MREIPQHSSSGVRFVDREERNYICKFNNIFSTEWFKNCMSKAKINQQNYIILRIQIPSLNGKVIFVFLLSILCD